MASAHGGASLVRNFELSDSFTAATESDSDEEIKTKGCSCGNIFELARNRETFLRGIAYP